MYLNIVLQYYGAHEDIENRWKVDSMILSFSVPLFYQGLRPRLWLLIGPRQGRVHPRRPRDEDSRGNTRSKPILV